MRNDKEMHAKSVPNDNYFLRLYVYTCYADSKRSVSDRWLKNEK